MLDRIPRWSIRNRAVVDIFIILWIIGGLIAFSSIRREFFPQISVDAISITTIYSGATPEDVERLVTSPLEDELVDIVGIDDLISQSAEGSSTIFIQVDPDVASVSEVLRETEQAVEKVTDLPGDAEKPQVIQMKFEEPSIVVALLGEATWRTKKQIVDRLEDEFRTIGGVSSVIIAGLSELEIEVAVDPIALSARGITSAQISRAISDANADVPAGILQTENGDLLVRTSGTIDTAEEVSNVVIKSTPNGIIRVGDVATVSQVLTRERTRSRINGRPATILNVLKSAEGDIYGITEKVRGIVEEESTRIPESLSLVWVQDRSELVKERMSVTYTAGIWGICLVFILLALFLDIRSAIWCAIGIPISILGALLIMYSTGSTLNMLTLFGFILVIGMVVDDAIIVVENVARYREGGLSPHEAVVRGTTEMAKPVTAAVLTTIAALLPMSLMTGVMGRFMAEIPKPGMFALTASLAEALITLPVHLYITATWGRPHFLQRPLRDWDKIRAKADRLMHRIRRFHRRTLVQSLRHRYIFLVGTLTLFVLSIVAAIFLLRFELFSTPDTPIFLVEVEGTSGASLAETEELVSKAEQAILDLPEDEILSISTTVGMRRTDQGSTDFGRELAQIMVELGKPEVRERDAQDIMDALRPNLAAIKGGRVVIGDMQGGPPVGKPINVRLSGPDWDHLDAFGREIEGFLDTLTGVTDISDNLKKGNREIVVIPDASATAMAGLTPLMIAQEVRAAVDGIQATSIRRDDEEVEIIVRYSADRRTKAADISGIWISSPVGAVPLTNVAEVQSQRGWSVRRHYDGKRTVTVTADIQRGGIEAGEAVRQIRGEFSDKARAAGISLEFGGEAEDTAESMASLGVAAFIAIGLITIILVFQFGNFMQPLAVLSALPMAIIGVIITLIAHTWFHELTGRLFETPWLFPTPLGLLPLIGMTALLGVIVNDSIILVDFINNSRKAGGGRWHSIVQAGSQRIRPVLLTSVTTSAGVLPMAYTLRGGSAFLAPMALSFGWGLIFGTLLILLVVPVMVAILDDIHLYFTSDRTSENSPTLLGHR